MRLFHKLMLYQLFGESLSFSDGHNAIIEYLLSARCNSFNINTWLSDVGSSILPLCGLFAHRDTAYRAQSINSAPVERMSWPGLWGVHPPKRPCAGGILANGSCGWCKGTSVAPMVRTPSRKLALAGRGGRSGC